MVSQFQPIQVGEESQLSDDTDWSVDFTKRDQENNIEISSSLLEDQFERSVEKRRDKERECRVVLFGKTGCGKSSLGNSLLSHASPGKPFITGSVGSRVNAQSKRQGVIDGTLLTVVDTPGLFDTYIQNEETVMEILKSISLCTPGPHVIIFVLSLGRFTQEEVETMDVFKKLFGAEAMKHVIVVFTGKDVLDNDKVDLDDFVKSSPHYLQEFLKECNNRHVGIANRPRSPTLDSDVENVIKLIYKTMAANGNKVLSPEAFAASQIVIDWESRGLTNSVIERAYQILCLEEEKRRELERAYQILCLEEEKRRELERAPLITDEYQMNRSPRGMCVILNIEHFTYNPNDRGAIQLKDLPGSSLDRDMAEATFTALGFIVKIHNDLTADEMVKTLTEYSEEDHYQYDCFVCVILSHGKKDHILGSDGKPVPIRRLTNPFKNQSCLGLSGKPKLFFIQACQGQEEQFDQVKVDLSGGEVIPDEPDFLIGVSTVPNFVLYGRAETGNATQDIYNQIKDAPTIQNSNPNNHDILIGTSTVPDFVSYRRPETGSSYIQILCKALQEYSNQYHILNILTYVNREVGKLNADIQSPGPLFTLRKQLFFRPLSSV